MRVWGRVTKVKRHVYRPINYLQADGLVFVVKREDKYDENNDFDYLGYYEFEYDFLKVLIDENQYLYDLDITHGLEKKIKEE